MTQPNDTTAFRDFDAAIDDSASVAAIVAVTAQQAVLPRRLEEGIYAILDADGAVQIVETPGYELKREDDYQQLHSSAPERVWRQVTVLDVASFLDYIGVHADEDHLTNAHGAGQLEVWADVDARTVKAVIDGVHGWRKHTATLQLKVSREWSEWSAVDGKLLGQVDFAEFIEDHLSTIAEPDGATLLEICQTLQVHTSAQFKQQNILATGQRVFRFEEDLETKAGTKGDLKIPGELTLVLRPFQGSAAVAVTARFRFQVREGVLRLGVKLAEPDKALEDAFAGVVADVQASVPVHVNHGRG